MDAQQIHPQALAYIGWDMDVPFRPSDFCAFPNLSLRAVLYLGLTWPHARSVRQIARACHIPTGSVYTTLMRLVRMGLVRRYGRPGWKSAHCYSLLTVEDEKGEN